MIIVWGVASCKLQVASDGNGMNIELVALDMDGTLLASNGTLSARNVKALLQAQAQGVGVVLATGKTYWAAVEVIAELGLILPGVFSQGLIVCEADGTILREIVLDHDLVNDLLAYLERQGLPYIAYNRDGLLTPEQDHYNDNINVLYGEPAPRVMGPMVGRAAELQINKLLVGDEDDVPSRCIELQRRYGREANIFHAVPEYVDLIPLGTSKGAGVGWMLERLGIAPQAMLAMGDSVNDIEMLNMAGIGVAVGNARSELKVVADYVVGSNDDGGVAEALERFILSGE